MTKRRREAHELAAAVAETMPVKDGGRDARDEGVNYARWGQARYVVNHLRLFFA